MKESKIRYYIFLGILLVILTGFANIFGQEFRGTITGTVTDPNGAAIAGATVVVKNIETNVAKTVTTNEQGSYTVPFLLPGKYSVSVTNEGFKTSTQENITLNVDDRLTVDVQMEIGSTTEVTIVGDTELIERGSVTLGTVVSNRQVEELPLAEGAPYTLVTQAPGVIYTGNPQFEGPTANGNLASFRTNGAGGNQISLDGSPNFAFSGQVGFTPPSDAVQEFKVQTNSFDAQNGFTAGSIVNVALKSGTNKLHGSAYYYDRDKSRTANDFFNNRNGIEQPERKYYRYGGVLNGPVFIPKIYNGKDRTFFLFAYERQFDDIAQPTTFTVPTAKMRMGDFSELIVNRNNINDSANTVIYNPFSGTQSGSNVTRQSFGCNVAANTPVPANCNILPANLINQGALALLQLYPEPNREGLTDNYYSNMNLQRPYKSYIARIDHNINSNNKIFGKFYHSRNTEDRYNWIGTPDAITRGYEYRRNWGGNVDFTSTLSSNFILDIRTSYNQFSQERAQANPLSPADLGFTGIAAISDSTVFPRFDFRNYSTLGSQRADWNEGLYRPFSMYSIQPTVTQIFGNHTFRYGYDYRLLSEKNETNGYNAGRFFFDGTYTAPASNSSSTLRNAVGRDLAAFLLGVATTNTNSLIETPREYDVSSNYHGFFFQDDWRVNNRLTLNLGLRYELETGVRETEGRIITGFDTTTVNPINNQVLAQFDANPPSGVDRSQFRVIGGLLFADGNGDVNQSTDKNNFQPRIGVSYAINDKTVIRGGFGIFSATYQIQAINQTGFSTSTAYVPTLNNGLTITSTLTNPFPSGLNTPSGSSLGLQTFLGRDLTATNAIGPTSSILSFDRKNPNYARFVIGLQRELPYKIGLDVAYVHSRGYDLFVDHQINYIPTQYLNTGNQFDQATQDFLNASVPNPFRGLLPGTSFNGNTIQRRFLLTTFPGFGNVAVSEYDGTSTYNALQIQVAKRFTTGLSLNSSFTYSREREKTARLNPQDTELTEFVSPTDRPYRFTFSGIYPIPIGRGKTFGSDWNRVVDAFIGGWQLQALYEWQSGEPVQFGNVYYEGDPTKLVNRLGEKDEQGRRYGVDIPAFDISGFYPGGVVPSSSPSAIGLGNNYTYTSTNTLRYFPLTLSNFRNQPFVKINLGLSKNFQIREGMKLQFRVEGINIVKDPWFTAVNLDPTRVPINLADPADPRNLGRFGYTTTQRQPSRDIQLGVRFTF